MSLTQLLTNIANAIRNKNGKTDLIPAQNFAEEINNLPSGDELIGEYEITNSTTASIIFDNLNIVQGEIYYLHMENLNAEKATVTLGMSVDDLKGSSTGYSRIINFDVESSSTHYNSTKRSNFGILGITRNTNECIMTLTLEGFTVASIGAGYVIGARFYGETTVPPSINKITLYGGYTDETTTFAKGAKIQLYKQVKA